MPATPPSRTERLVRAVLLLLTSALLTGVALLLGFSHSQDPTTIWILVLIILAVAVAVSRFGAKALARRYDWN